MTISKKDVLVSRLPPSTLFKLASCLLDSGSKQGCTIRQICMKCDVCTRMHAYTCTMYACKDIELRQQLLLTNVQLSRQQQFELKRHRMCAQSHVYTLIMHKRHSCMLGLPQKRRTDEMIGCDRFRSACLTMPDSRAYVSDLPCSRAYAVHVCTRMQCGASLVPSHAGAGCAAAVMCTAGHEHRWCAAL